MIQNYVTLIAAVAAALVSIISAWRGEGTRSKVADLAASVAPRPVFVPAPQPPGGNSVAEIGRWLEFFRSLFGESAPGALAPGFGFADILKYLSVFMEVSAFFETLHGLPVGQVAMTPVLKTKVGGRHGELGPAPFVFKD